MLLLVGKRHCHQSQSPQRLRPLPNYERQEKVGSVTETWSPLLLALEAIKQQPPYKNPDAVKKAVKKCMLKNIMCARNYDPTFSTSPVACQIALSICPQSFDCLSHCQCSSSPVLPFLPLLTPVYTLCAHLACMHDSEQAPSASHTTKVDNPEESLQMLPRKTLSCR